MARRRNFLLIMMACSWLVLMTAACSNQTQELSDIAKSEVEAQPETVKADQVEAGRIAEIWREGCEDAGQTDTEDNLALMQKVIERLGENGYVAVDSENQIDMTNAGQVLAFCSAVESGESVQLTIVEVINTATCEFRKYDFRAADGRVDIGRGYYYYDADGNLVREDHVSYPADVWQYTDDGYLLFAGSYFADDYYIMSTTAAPEYAALRVEPLDAKYRALCKKYIQPVGYEGNNLFLVNWNEENVGELDFYDLFDQLYPLCYRRTVPYTASENPGNGVVYQIAEMEFEGVIGAYLDVDMNVLRSHTNYFSENGTYEYRPRGFYEIGCTNMPYPEVVSCTENSDNTITLLVNAVFPYEYTSRAFSHEVVIRPLEDGGFQYVSNQIVGGDYDAWWYTARLTDAEWEELYAGNDAAEDFVQLSDAGWDETYVGNDAIEADNALWYLPQADDCLLTKNEQAALMDKALDAARHVSEIYQNMEIEEGASYSSNVLNFNSTMCKEVVSLLGKAGYVSVTEDANMENYEQLESFYAAYESGQDATVTVYEVNRDGLIGAVTLIYRCVEEQDAIQIYYVGVGWKEGGVPAIKNTLVSDVEEILLTDKGYFIYTYADQIIHSNACQHWRVKPLSEKCRELTKKYVAGISFVNYNAFVTDWDSSNVEEILMPCMFEDIYRMATGENLWAGDDWIPAELYERIMMTYFPVSREQLRARCGYDADSDSYPYEMIFAAPYAPFGEVVDYRVSDGNADGTITLIVDGVWIDYHTDCAFTNEIVVKPFSDGTFQYISDRLVSGDWGVP